MSICQHLLSAFGAGHRVIESLAVVFISVCKTLKIFFHQYGKGGAIVIGQAKLETYLVGCVPAFEAGKWQQEMNAVVFHFNDRISNIFSPYAEVKRTGAYMRDRLYFSGAFQQFHIRFIEPVSYAVTPDPYFHIQ